MLAQQVKHSTTRTLHPRPLTEKERSLTRWLIEHAKCGEEEKKKYLSQLEAATVVRMCECGCASIDFAIAGVASEQFAPLHPFGDFIAKDRRFGVFVFSKREDLAGVEIYPLGSVEASREFPDPSELVPAEWKEANQSAQTTSGS